MQELQQEHRYVEANGIRLHCVDTSSPNTPNTSDRPAVLLLHGFPDFWYSWRHQLPALAAAGFRAIAPDLRGYNLSDRPVGISRYKLDLLATDIADLIRHMHLDRPVLVGHDWGGIIGWHLAMHQPEIIRSLVVLNAPHPATFRRELRRFSSQILRSWYAFMFQLPKIPEAAFSARDFAVLKRALRNGPTGNEQDMQRYLPVFTAPQALTAAINYYRAAIRYPPPAPKPVGLPTLVLWGMKDPFLSPKLADGLENWTADLEVVKLPNAGHWLHHSHAVEVDRQILNFIRRTAHQA